MKHSCVRQTLTSCSLSSTGARPTPQACAATGSRTSDLLVHKLAQSTEPHQPGLYFSSLIFRTNYKACVTHNLDVFEWFIFSL